MSNLEPNPYDPPLTHSKDPSHARFRWRLIPAILFFAVGSVSLCIGVFAVYVIVVHSPFKNLSETIACCTLYFGTGTSWTTAGWFYLHGQFRNALIATGLGIVIPVILFGIMGF